MVILNVFTLIMAGCGSSGGGGGGGTTGNTVISGIASKGLIKGGTVTIYALDESGIKGVELGTTVTDDDGTYSVDLKLYIGNVLAEITGGHFTDEATGADIDAPPLSAALTNAHGNVSAAITPLTDIAVKCAGSELTTANINGANGLVAAALGINDIIGTMPHDVGSHADPGEFNKANYGLMLASISQIASGLGGDAYANMVTAINTIADDLKVDHKLDITGQTILTAFDEFANDLSKNKTGTTGVPDIVQSAVTHAIDTDPYPDFHETQETDLMKAKELVADLRNTTLSIYNYNGVGMKGIVETPFTNLSEELTTKMNTDLESTVKRIGWIVDSVKKMSDSQDDPLVVDNKLQGGLHTFTHHNLRLEVTVTLTSANNEAGFTSANFAVKDVRDKLNIISLDDGTLTLTADDVSGKIVSGTFIAHMSTSASSGEKVVASLAYTATYNGDAPASMTLTGNLTAPEGLSFDFSKDGRKLYATFAPVPDDAPNAPHSENELENYYPTSIFFSGRITTSTAQMDGNLNVSSIVWNSTDSDNEGCDVHLEGFVPESVRFEGSFQELKNGSANGARFWGRIVGNWDNAATYDMCAGPSSTNFPQWNAYFDGNITAPQRPTIAARLAAGQSTETGYQKYNLSASYLRTDVDGTVVHLDGTGTYDDNTRQLQATLINQDNMTVTFTYNNMLAKTERLTGAIKTSGGSIIADIYNVNGLPTVKYEDDYIETVF
jgi:hypothetical protein